MLDWLWSRKNKPEEAKQPENKDDLGFLDPKLKEFYEQNKPVAPITLAPKEVRDQHEREQKQLAEEQSVPDYKQAERGLHQIQENAAPRGLPLGQAARNNCVEYEALMANCSLNGTYWEKFNLCHIYRKQQMRCVELQEDALKKLGYQKAASHTHRTDIQNRCDDLYSQVVPDGPITDDIVQKFNQAVEKERLASEIYRA